MALNCTAKKIWHVKKKTETTCHTLPLGFHQSISQFVHRYLLANFLKFLAELFWSADLLHKMNKQPMALL